MIIENTKDLGIIIEKRMKELGLNYYQLQKLNPELSYHTVSRAVKGENIVSSALIELLKEIDLINIISDSEKAIKKVDNKR